MDRNRDCNFASVRELADTIIAFMAERNQNPKRYVWKAKGEVILRKIQQARIARSAGRDSLNVKAFLRHYTRMIRSLL